jgi:hypothetical protein
MCTLLDEMLLPESVIADLAQSLPFPARVAFREAALEVIAQLGVTGPGNTYRTLVVLQAQFFDPPADTEHGPRVVRPNKLINQPPIKHARRGSQGVPLPVV